MPLESENDDMSIDVLQLDEVGFKHMQSDFKAIYRYVHALGYHKKGAVKIRLPGNVDLSKSLEEFMQMGVTSFREQSLVGPEETPVRGGYEYWQFPNARKYQKEPMKVKDYYDKYSYAKYWVKNGDLAKEVLEEFSSLAFKKSRRYATDVVGTGFEVGSIWHFGMIKSITDEARNHFGLKIEGVNTDPYLYFSIPYTFACWHVEDLDTCSINFMHHGTGKMWAVIPPEYGKKFEVVARKFYGEDWTRKSGFIRGDINKCKNDFLRHKHVFLFIDFLRKNGIPVYTTIQEKGEIIVTFPYAYHMVINLGNSINEAINFGFEDWLGLAVYASKCLCSDYKKVTFDLQPLLCKYGWKLIDKFKNRELDGPHPSTSNPIFFSKAREHEPNWVEGLRMATIKSGMNKGKRKTKIGWIEGPPTEITIEMCLSTPQREENTGDKVVTSHVSDALAKRLCTRSNQDELSSCSRINLISDSVGQTTQISSPNMIMSEVPHTIMREDVDHTRTKRKSHHTKQIVQSLCTECGKFFKSKESLGDHVRNVHRKQMWLCPHCAKVYETKNGLKYHLKAKHCSDEDGITGITDAPST